MRAIKVVFASLFLVVASFCSAAVVVDGAFPETVPQLRAHTIEQGHTDDLRGMLDALLDLHEPANGYAMFNLYADVMAKGYSVGSAEWTERYDIFRKKVEFITEHNSNGSAEFTLGLNMYSDWTDAEFKATFLDSIVRNDVSFLSEHFADWIPF
jgi:hypothetical protein